MVATAWILLGLVALCGNTWSHPVGDANLNTSAETEISSASSESSEDTGLLAELKPLEVADPEGTTANDQELEATSQEDGKSSEEASREGEGRLEEGSEVRATSESSLPTLPGDQAGERVEVSDS